MNRLSWPTRFLAAVAIATLSACSTTGQGAAGESAQASAAAVPAPVPADTLQGPRADSAREMPVIAPPTTADTANGRADVARLEREARALAHTTGCSSASACRTAPVGAKACGGPRTYIVYCAASTDSVALFRKLAELERAEKAYNARSGMMSTCEFRMPPTPALIGQRCTEAPAAP